MRTEPSERPGPELGCFLISTSNGRTQGDIAVTCPYSMNRSFASTTERFEWIVVHIGPTTSGPGLADGLGSGSTDGVGLGLAEGVADGLALGLAEGLADGLALGLGLAEGPADGLADGLGSALGEELGEADGDGSGSVPMSGPETLTVRLPGVHHAPACT